MDEENEHKNSIDSRDITLTIPEREPKRRRRISSEDEPNRAPKHVHGGDWKDMIHMTKRKRGQSVRADGLRARAMSSIKGNSWIEHKLRKIECSKFVPTQKLSTRCGCGAQEDQHSHSSGSSPSTGARDPNHLTAPGGYEEAATTDLDASDYSPRSNKAEKWTIAKNTTSKPTDCYGSILFEGTSHQSRAQFVRASFDTEPESLCHLLEKIWRLPPPKLVITIHGGLTNFDLQPKMARLFRKGILKAAKSTDAWIITNGLNAGVVRHVASALEDLGSSRSRSRVISIGIAPWGMLKRRHRLQGKDVAVNYTTNQFNKSRFAELNDRHSYFIFADNGTTGRYGAEIILRKRFEGFLSQKIIQKDQSNVIPVVCVVLEGGAFTIKVVNDYVNMIPRIPVVVCDGSGRAADLLAFTHKAMTDEGKLPEPVKQQLYSLVESVFNYDKKSANRLVNQLIECCRQKHLLTIFRFGDSQRQDVDHAILKALLKGKNLSPPEQLKLALAWNRADIARSEIFTMGTEWSTRDLHDAMMEALSHDRTDFVQLLLENGVSMHRFLTIGRLEHLYNTKYGPTHTLRNFMGIASKPHHVKLTEVGNAMEDLMGNAYKSNYTKEDFKAKHYIFTNRKQLGYMHNKQSSMEPQRQNSENLRDENGFRLLKNARQSIVSIFQGSKEKTHYEDEDEFSNSEEDALDFTFSYPYSELLIWAVLTKRREMAKLMWRHGEEALAKSLVACRLFQSLANEASTNFLELEICEDLLDCGEEFRTLSFEVLQYCSSQNVDQTLQLLTYELENWGNETCLSLAALDNNRKFLAHPCCQLLLSDLWHGGLRIRASSNMKVLSCILVPPALFLLGYKSKEELKLQPHTAAEHHEELEAESSDSEESSEYSDISETSDSEDEEPRTPDNPQPLSFHQLMRDKMPFRTNVVAPTPNGTANLAITEPQGKSRSRSISQSKMRKKNEENDVEKGKIRRKSTAKTMQKMELNSEEMGSEREMEPRQSRIGLSRKVKEFYSAPITTFWLWSISFFVFLISLIFVLVIETPRQPSWLEWWLFIYVVVWSIEVIRKLVMSIIVDTNKSVWRQTQSFFFTYRTGMLSFALATYIASFIIRLNPGTLALGRVLLASNSVLWSLKLIDYLSVHRQLGPYVTMASEMLPRIWPILTMLFVALLSFGLIRQSITYPYEDWHWLLLRNIFFKPYFMLYGEVYAPEIDTCGDEVWDTHIEEGIPIKQLNVTHDTCVPGYFVVPMFMTVFMVIANVLLMNTMVACCTYVFESNIEKTQEIWLFERYRQVMEYESTPFMPPPFTIVYHVWWIFKWILVKEHFDQRKQLLDASLKLFLTEEEVERIHSFEEESVEDMEREKDTKKQSSNDERIYRTAERTDLILNRVNYITTVENLVKSDVHELEQRLQNLEYRHREEVDQLRTMNGRLEQLLEHCLGDKYKPSQPQSILKVNLEPTTRFQRVGSSERQRKTPRASPRVVFTAASDDDDEDNTEEKRDRKDQSYYSQDGLSEEDDPLRGDFRRNSSNVSFDKEDSE